MKTNRTQLLLVMMLFLFITNTFAQDWNEIIKLSASETSGYDRFGISVAIDGDYALVGARHNSITGSAYIFERDEFGTWNEVQRLRPADSFSREFGNSVSISGDYAIIGAPWSTNMIEGNNISSSGSAHIFERDAFGVWHEVQKIISSDIARWDNFGTAVSISGNNAVVTTSRDGEDATGGNTMNYAGSAYVFERDPSGTWSETQKIVASDRAARDGFGYSVSSSADYIFVGAWAENGDAGAAYIFKKDVSEVWNEVQKIVASDRSSPANFSHSISISGDMAIVGAIHDAKDAEGNNSTYRTGSAYIFELDESGNWNQTQKIVASDRSYNGMFGSSVSISGNHALVGAYYRNRAYLFKQNESGEWIEVQKIQPSDGATRDYFGTSVSISGSSAIVGAPHEPQEPGGGVYDPAAAYIFESSTITNISTPLEEDNFKVFPNPVSQQFNIEAKDLTIESIDIINSKGVLMKTVSSADKVDVSGLEKGVYLLQIRSRNDVINKRFVKE